MSKQEPRPCESCGDVFTPKNPRRAGRFCSFICFKSARELPEINCQNCGEQFKPSQRTIRYCSLSCAAQDRPPKTALCEHCGAEFRPKTTLSKFCSREHFQQHVKDIASKRADALIPIFMDRKLSQAEIGNKFGLTKNQICGIRRRLGLPARIEPNHSPGSRSKNTAIKNRAVEFRPKAFQECDQLRLIAGSEPLPPMHPISWGAIAL